MALSQKHIATALHEAFTQYVTFLTSSRKQHEETLPRLGKVVETTVDLTWEQYFHERLGAAEICLQHSERIAQNVRKWSSEPVIDEVEEQSHGANLDTFQSVGQFEDVWSFRTKVEDDEPFLDIFSGALIQPKTKYSAGPSGTYDQPTSTRQSPQNGQNTKVWHIFHLNMALVP
jgi:hypothetical protein